MYCACFVQPGGSGFTPPFATGNWGCGGMTAPVVVHCFFLLMLLLLLPQFHSLFSSFIFSFICTAFGGDKSLKLLQQLVAASQAGRDMVFHPFAQNYNGKSMEEWTRLLNEMITLHHLTVGKENNE